jgi:hypothetical protein
MAPNVLLAFRGRVISPKNLLYRALGVERKSKDDVN